MKKNINIGIAKTKKNMEELNTILGDLKTIKARLDALRELAIEDEPSLKADAIGSAIDALLIAYDKQQLRVLAACMGCAMLKIEARLNKFLPGQGLGRPGFSRDGSVN